MLIYEIIIDKTMENTKNASLSKLVPVMLCFFAMGFVDLVGISNHRAYRMSGGICIVEEDQKKQGRKFKLRRSQLWKRES